MNKTTFTKALAFALAIGTVFIATDLTAGNRNRGGHQANRGDQSPQGNQSNPGLVVSGNPEPTQLQRAQVVMARIAHIAASGIFLKNPQQLQSLQVQIQRELGFLPPL